MSECAAELPIATPRLVLRAFSAADLDAFLAYRNDAEVARFQSWETISPEAASAFVGAPRSSVLGTRGEWRQIAIARRDDDALIGDIGLRLREDGLATEIGYTIARSQQRRGYAREAVARLIDALFGRAGVERVEAVTDARNAASIALLERLGFVLESTAEAQFKGAPCTEHTYALVRAAWDGPLGGRDG